MIKYYSVSWVLIDALLPVAPDVSVHCRFALLAIILNEYAVNGVASTSQCASNRIGIPKTVVRYIGLVNAMQLELMESHHDGKKNQKH
jgi:hypothetical protein